MKISTKILLPLLVTLTLGFFVSTIVTYQMGNAALERASADSQKMAIANAIVELEEEFEFNVLNAISLAQTGLLQPYLDGTPAQREANIEGAQDRIINMRDTYSYVMLGIADTNGVILCHTEEKFVGKSFADELFFIEAMSGKVAVGIPFRYKGQVVYRVASPVYHTQPKEIIGVVFNVSRLSDTMSERMHLGNEGYVMVAASDGLVFIHKDNAKILAQNMNDVPWGQTMLATKNGDILFKKNGKEKIAYYDTLADTGWLAVAVVDVAELRTPSIAIRDNGFLVAFIILILLSFIVYLCVRPIIKALLKAVNYAENIARGNLNDKLDIYQKDEIGKLCDSLRNMVETLKEKIEDANIQAEVASQKSKEALIAKQDAENSAQIKTQFLANVSHEIRTPINAILGLSDLLTSSSLVGENLEHVKNIRQSSSVLLIIINDILDISKLEAGRLELIPVHYLLMQSINHITTLSRGLAQAKNLESQIITPEDTDLCLYGDDIRLRQILLNLLSNAIKFTEKGSVSLGVYVKKDTVEFVIKDSGIGMKEEEIKHMFNPFYQADRLRNRNVQGTGLGLTISHSLATLMNGSITAESVPGQGTTFKLTIPKIPGDKTLFEKNHVQSTFTTKNAQVLVVDDMDLNLYVAKALLEKYGIHVVTSTSGAEALKLIQKEKFDFVFMDYYMPDMDGLETTLAIRELGPEFVKLPVIALTANAMAEDKNKCKQATMDDFLSKPIERHKLHAILERWIPEEKRIYDQAGLGSILVRKVK